MKNKFRTKRVLKRMGRRVWSVLSKNIAIKLLSLVFAVFLWSFVVTTNPSITREKTLSDVDIAFTGQSVLSGRGLALLTDIADMGQARVVIEAPQSSYMMVNEENVRVEADLSSIRDVGTRSVRLRGSSAYGTVAQVWPEYVSVEVEDQGQRYAPVNTIITGEDVDNYWYSVTRVNPSQVLVTGPESYVQLLSNALVDIDVSGKTAPVSRVEDFTLRDANETVLDDKLSASTRSVSVSVDIYPKKRLEISALTDEVITGTPPAGYKVESVSVSPTSVTAAGDEALLSEISSLTLAAVDVSEARRSFTAITSVNAIKGIKYLSMEDVTVSVVIAEESLVKRFSDIAVECVNHPENCDCVLSQPRVDLRVKGPYSKIRGMTRGDVRVVVDLNGLSPGKYELPLEFVADNYTDVMGEITPLTVSVTIFNNDDTL